MQHPEEGIIHAWLDGALDEVEQRAVAQHVASCSVCAAAVAEARGMIAGASRIVSMLDGVPGGVIPGAPQAPVPARSHWTTRRITPRRVTVAAIAASIVIVSATMMKNVRHDDAAPVPASATAPMAAISAARADTIAPIARLAPTASTAPIAGAPLAEAPAPEPVAEKTAATPAKAAPPHVSMLEDASRVATETRPAPRADSGTVPTRMAATGIAPTGIAPRSVPPTASASPAVASTSAVGAAPGFANAARRAGAVSATSPLQLSSVTTTGATSAGASTFVGCYRVEGDSTIWPRSLPVRFSLAQVDTSAGATRNVVRVVGPDGRVDTAASAGTWSPLTPTTAHVSFTALGAQEVTLQFASNGTVLAAGMTSGRSTPLMLARGSCRP